MILSSNLLVKDAGAGAAAARTRALSMARARTLLQSTMIMVLESIKGDATALIKNVHVYDMLKNHF